VKLKLKSWPTGNLTECPGGDQGAVHANQLRKHPLALWPVRWYKRKTVESRENLLHGAEGEVASRTEVLNLSQLSGIKCSAPAKCKKTLELASATGLTFGDRASRRVCAVFARTSKRSFLNLNSSDSARAGKQLLVVGQTQSSRRWSGEEEVFCCEKQQRASSGEH